MCRGRGFKYGVVVVAATVAVGRKPEAEVDAATHSNCTNLKLRGRGRADWHLPLNMSIIIDFNCTYSGTESNTSPLNVMHGFEPFGKGGRHQSVSC